MLFDLSKLNEDILLANLARARYKFIWLMDEIETYTEVLRMAVEQTLMYFQPAPEKVGPNDIGYFGTKASKKMKSLFFLYIRDRRFSGLFSLYKQFREEYNSLTTGYVSGLDTKIETLANIPPSDLSRIGFDHETIKHNIKILQSYKRPITRFDTLANKSLNKRRIVPPRMRYRVLRRDNSTCQLCGRSAPEVILEVDHKKSVIDGGSSDMKNLWTLCRDCNRGKGPTTLWDEVIKKLRNSTR